MSKEISHLPNFIETTLKSPALVTAEDDGRGSAQLVMSTGHRRRAASTRPSVLHALHQLFSHFHQEPILLGSMHTTAIAPS